MSEMAFGFIESKQRCVVLDIPWSGRPDDVDEQPFRELLYANQVEFAVAGKKALGGRKQAEVQNLTAACSEPTQLHPLLDHLFRKWFWFEFTLRCYGETASRPLAEQAAADWLNAFEHVGILNEYEARMQQLTIELAKRCSVAWRIPSDRDYFEIASESISFDSLHRRLQKETEKYGVVLILKQAE